MYKSSLRLGYVFRHISAWSMNTGTPHPVLCTQAPQAWFMCTGISQPGLCVPAPLSLGYVYSHPSAWVMYTGISLPGLYTGAPQPGLFVQVPLSLGCVSTRQLGLCVEVPYVWANKQHPQSGLCN
jgi:hypothetical protein